MFLHRRPLVRPIFLLVLALALSACSAIAPQTAPTEPPVAPTVLAPTATAPAAPPAATPTPIPPTLAPPTATLSPTPDIAATQAAEATAAVAPILAKINTQLGNYGLSTEQGHLGWLHDPYSIELDSYMQDDIHTDYPDLIVSDFVLQADITWSTTTGVAGCGFAVRGGPDFEHGDSYQVAFARLGPLWDIEYYEAGKFYENLTGFRDALPLDDELDSTNTVTVVAQGNKLGLYANGQELDTITDTHLNKGVAAFLSWQESGKTSCSFENGWLWILED